MDVFLHVHVCVFFFPERSGKNQAHCTWYKLRNQQLRVEKYPPLCGEDHTSSIYTNVALQFSCSSSWLLRHFRSFSSPYFVHCQEKKFSLLHLILKLVMIVFLVIVQSLLVFNYCSCSYSSYRCHSVFLPLLKVCAARRTRNMQVMSRNSFYKHVDRKPESQVNLIMNKPVLSSMKGEAEHIMYI